MNKSNKLLIVLLILNLDLVRAQVLEFSEPTPIDILNSEAEDISPLVSPDGKTLYFVRSFFKGNTGGELAGMDIWVSQKDSLGQWQEPSNKVPRWNNYENNVVVGIRADSKVVYMLNSYNRGNGIAFTKLLNGKWIKPELLEFSWLKKKEFVGYYMHPDFDVLLISMKGDDTEGMEDLYISVRDSLFNWSKPINLGRTINTDGFEISPFLSADKQRLYFASNGHGGFGDADIFMSERLYDNWTVWSKPVNLGNEINSKNFDAYFSIGNDSTIYFASNKGEGLSNIYSARIKLQRKNILKDSINAILNEADSILNSLEIFNDDRNQKIYVSFNRNEVELTDVMSENIKNLFSSVNQEKVIAVVLRGFTSEYVNNNLNLKLIKKRIDVINDYLLKLGVRKSIINRKTTVSSVGDSLHQNDVEIRIILK